MTPWWTEQAAGLIGGIGGGGLGALGGCIGAAIGICAPRGIARTALLGSQWLLTLIGIGALAGGLIAIVDQQPSHVHFPLIAGGAVLAGVMGALIPVTLTAYRIGEARRAAESNSDQRAPISALDLPGSSPGMPTRVMRAMIDAWGPGSACRRWSKRAGWAALAVAGASGLAASLSLTGSIRPGIAGSMGQLALVAALDGIMLIVIGVSMGRQADRFAGMLDEQRLAAEEFRRG
ncbi:MAG: hypothetical protein AB7K52_13415 [Phycisphaerales bacterium]